MKHKMIVILICFFITGCVDGGDYIISLPNNYLLDASPAHHIVLYRADGISIDMQNYIPPKVVELGWNSRYIIAKQYGMKKEYPNNPDNDYEIPDESKIYYWILDTEEQIKYGPYESFKEYTSKINELGIQDLTLKKLDEYEKKFIEW